MSLLRRIEKGGGGSGGGGGQSGPPEPGGSSAEGASKLSQMRVQNKAAPAKGSSHTDLKQRVQEKLLSELDPSMDASSPTFRATVEDLFTTILSEENIAISRSEKHQLFDAIIAEILGFGPLELLLSDDTISEIMVNGPNNIYVEQRGNLTRSTVTFENDDHVLRVIDRIVAPLGRRIDESQPYVDARLPDGSRVNAIIRPLALCGPSLTIRKFSKKPLQVEDLIKFGSMSPEIAEFLRACVISRQNIVVAGGTGSGKTTLLNVLSNFIPNDERIITIENAAELQLAKDHVVGLESRPPNIEGKGEVSIRDLVINTLRMRPDRVVVGECRGGETLDMLQAMNTGHDGSLTTAHANSPRDAVKRLEVMSMMAGMDLPLKAIREQIASAVNVFVQQQRLRDGSRRIINITEVRSRNTSQHP